MTGLVGGCLLSIAPLAVRQHSTGIGGTLQRAAQQYACAFQRRCLPAAAVPPARRCSCPKHCAQRQRVPAVRLRPSVVFHRYGGERVALAGGTLHASTVACRDARCSHRCTCAHAKHSTQPGGNDCRNAVLARHGQRPPRRWEGDCHLAGKWGGGKRGHQHAPRCAAGMGGDRCGTPVLTWCMIRPSVWQTTGRCQEKGPSCATSIDRQSLLHARVSRR